jgi:uncharacterized membrane protein YphA (DoxX/SURF4 family)
MKETLNALLRHPATIRSCRIAIGLVFAWAGLAKIGDPASFAAQVHNFRMAPVSFENLVAIFLPWLELLAALALISGLHARAGALVTAAMMAFFTVAVALALFRGLDIECGCFGTADASRVGLNKLLENVGLTVVAAVATLRPR